MDNWLVLLFLYCPNPTACVQWDGNPMAVNIFVTLILVVMVKFCWFEVNYKNVMRRGKVAMKVRFVWQGEGQG